MKLTDTFVKRRPGNGQVQKHSDGGGLFLYITPGGQKSWRLGYRFFGKQKLLVIGPYPTLSLEEARQRREAAKKLLLDNIDPCAVKKAAKAAAAAADKNSLALVAREWWAKNSAAWAPLYKKPLLARLENDIFPYLGGRPIKSVTAPELLAVLQRIENRGAVDMAHRVLRVCGRIFRYAIATGRLERDIAADLRGALGAAVPAGFATLTDPRAVGRLLLTLDDYQGSLAIKCALRLAPLVFVRPGELVGAEWREFHLENAEWHIPAGRMKMRQKHIVPLAGQALSILETLREFNGPGDYLFPRRNKPAAPINTGALLSALRRLGYAREEMTVHGFRALAATILNERGYNRDWIERQLAHGDHNRIRAAYNYAEYLPERREMMRQWADYLDTLREKARAGG
ncbi:MAG: tyrosine-type recombinase/integrase [Candidatus Adiutrix sp.]|jgi:integrase|nr:tyrosine-type recombinase/integrase [Candidatus Adiutrix sp.]